MPDHTGGILRSDSLARAPYVLYFYPKDDTPGCTREACGFRDAGSELARLGVRVLGVSADSPASHARFRAKYSLDFPLISDVDRTLMAAYGAFGKKVLYGKATEGVIRSTFLVDAAGVVRKAWRNVKVDGHVDQVLGALRDL
ncbi:MAG: peroxiredoxin [Polyangiaceae bacterium]|nr:peroxiredoxin [Polyangiaceae bacterium]